MLTKFYGKETTMEELYFTIRSFQLENQYLNHHTILHLCEVFHSGAYPDCWLF